jgi:glycine/D-amino acid oxidase-like deaminating enzyme
LEQDRQRGKGRKLMTRDLLASCDSQLDTSSMDLRSGYPLWPVLDGLLAVWPPLEHDITCEVAILGGGITGALIADRLAEAGIDSVVIDQREIGWGATAGSTALLQYDLDKSLTDLIALRGEAEAVRGYRACVAALDELDTIITNLDTDVGYRRRQMVYLATRAADVAKFGRELALRRLHGIPVDLWSRAELRQETGMDRPAALTSVHAAQVDPYALTVALLRRAVSRGTRVFDRTAVTRIRTTAGRQVLVTDRGSTVTCRTVVRATGYETELLLRQQSVTLHSTYAFASEPVRGLPGQFPQLWEAARPYLYLRTTPDHRIIVGGEDDPFSSAERRDRALPAKVKRLQQKVKRLLPGLVIEPAYYWAGTFALCYGGNGITFATIAASIIRDRLLGRPSPDEMLFRFDRG